MRYFQYFPKYYLVISSVATGLPNVLRFTLGCFPIYVGYALFGSLCFGDYSEKFSTIGNSFETLFCVLNGDVILETFNEVAIYSPLGSFISRVYMYTFVCLFIFAVLNIFILIMTDAYNLVKERLEAISSRPGSIVMGNIDDIATDYDDFTSDLKQLVEKTDRIYTTFSNGPDNTTNADLSTKIADIVLLKFNAEFTRQFSAIENSMTENVTKIVSAKINDLVQQQNEKMVLILQQSVQKNLEDVTKKIKEEVVQRFEEKIKEITQNLNTKLNEQSVALDIQIAKQAERQQKIQEQINNVQIKDK